MAKEIAYGRSPVHSYYPIYLDLNGRHCIVIGEGPEAERAAQELLESRATVTVIGSKTTPAIKDLANRQILEWKSREYRSGDLKNAFLVISENNQTNTYEPVVSDAKSHNILINVINVRHVSNFISPHITRSGEVAFAISTTWLSPALAIHLKEKLEESPIMRWAEMGEMLHEVDLELNQKQIYPHPDRWRECLDEELLDLFESGYIDKAKERLTNMLSRQPTNTQTKQTPTT